MGSRQRKVEYVGLDGLRLDGRRPRDPREAELELGTRRDGADGAASLTASGTRVSAAVYGPKEMAGSRDELCAVSVSCHISATASASGQRRQDARREREYAATVRSVLESVMLRHLFPSSTVQVHLEVTSDDGSVLAALVNACSAALADAGIPTRDLTVATTASLVDKHLLVDVTDKETRAAGPTLTVGLLPASKEEREVVFMEFDNQADMSEVEALLDEAALAAERIHEKMEVQIVARTKQLLRTRPNEK